MNDQSNVELIKFIEGMSQKLKELENLFNDQLEQLLISDEGIKIKFKNSEEMDVSEIVDKINTVTEIKKSMSERYTKNNSISKMNNNMSNKLEDHENNNMSNTSDDHVNNYDKIHTNTDNNINTEKTGGSKYNFSDTSSVNGSFLNGRMNKYLRNSMTGGGKNSDTLASITELQVNTMPRYNSQEGGGTLSKKDFLSKMKNAGITSSTSEFC